MRKKIALFILPLAFMLSSCANIHIRGGCQCPKFNSIEKPEHGDKMAQASTRTIQPK